MGKHSGKQDANDVQGPFGPGPHPSDDESQKKADSFDAQWEASRLAGGGKEKRGEWRG